MRADLLSGPIVPALLKLAWPTAITSMLNGLVAALDVIMVGRLGEAAVAAVTTSRQALMVVLVSGSAVAAGCGVLVAQAIGRSDHDEADHVLTQSMVMFAFLVLCVLTPLGWYTAPWLLQKLTEDPVVVAQGVPYLRVVICSLFFTLTGFAASGALRGAGDPKTPLRVNVIANVINVVGNYCFIFGVPALHIPKCGVLGAAIGTILARGVSNLLLLIWLVSGKLVLRLEGPKHWKPDLPIFWRVWRIGFPTSISAISLNLYGVLVIGILAHTSAGRAAVAAYGLAMVLRNFGTWVTWGFSEATLAMVGQNLGAKQPERAAATGATAAKVASGFMLLLGLGIAAAAPHALPLVLNEADPARKAQVIAIAVLYLTTQAFALPFLGVSMSLRGALRGAGDTVAAMAIDVICLLAVGLPLCSFLALSRIHLGLVVLPGVGLGPLGVWIGMVCTPIANAALSMLYWRTGKWRQKRV